MDEGDGMTLPGHTTEEDIAEYMRQIKRREKELEELRQYVLRLGGQLTLGVTA